VKPGPQGPEDLRRLVTHCSPQVVIVIEMVFPDQTNHSGTLLGGLGTDQAEGKNEPDIALSSAYVVPKQEASVEVLGGADHDLQCENVINQELGSKPAHFHSLLGAVWDSLRSCRSRISFDAVPIFS
jgi:hypothetical protein